MAVFRVECTRDYTVMSNFHLRDKRLSLKAKGLLSQMLSLPEDWDYTLTGLARINRESKDAIRSAVNELEAAGYVQRHQTTDEGGQFGVNEYIIHKCPVLAPPSSENPTTVSPSTVSPSTVSPSTVSPSTVSPSTDTPPPENPTQLNTNRQITDLQKTDRPITETFPISPTAAAPPPDGRRRTVSAEALASYRSLIQANIGYDQLKAEKPWDLERLDEIVELMVETVCSRRKYIRVVGEDFPQEVVKSRLLKVDGEHIRYVLDCLAENTTQVRNIKQYLLAALYNAPTTMGNYYAAQVSHDLHSTD